MKIAYEAEKELKTLLDTYSDKEGFSREQLHPPVKKLTESLNFIFEIQKSFPAQLARFLQQVISPLFSTQEYEQSILAQIRGIAKAHNDPNGMLFAESLEYIRRVFKKNKDFVFDKFPDVLSAEEDEEKRKAYLNVLRTIFRTHTREWMQKVKKEIAASKVGKRLDSSVKSKIPSKLSAKPAPLAHSKPAVPTQLAAPTQPVAPVKTIAQAKAMTRAKILTPSSTINSTTGINAALIKELKHALKEDKDFLRLLTQALLKELLDEKVDEAIGALQQKGNTLMSR